MAMIRDFNREPGHKNWLKCVMALKTLQGLLNPFIDKETEKIHQELLRECGLDHCAKQCDFRNWKPRPHQIPPFECEVCSRWRDVIKTNSNGNGKLIWVNSTPHLWSQEKWEVAKVYMPDGHKNHNSVVDFDIAALLRLMNQCKHFKKFGLRDLCDRVASIRNQVMHSATFQVKQKDLQSYFHQIEDLGEVLARHDPEFESLSEDIDEILNLDYRLILPDDMVELTLTSLHEKSREEMLFDAVELVFLRNKVEDLEQRLSKYERKSAISSAPVTSRWDL